MKKVQDLHVGSADGGVLQFCELPFDVKRLYWLRGPSGMRGSHAHKELMQVFLCISGRVRIRFQDGQDVREVLMLPNQVLKVDPGLWREIAPLTEGDILLVGASEHFDEDDYIRDFGAFKDWKDD